jgi:hypothetical protein
MAGNNSCGSRSIRYGNMVHNVAAIEAVMADGAEYRFGAVPDDVSGLAGPRGYVDLVRKIRAIAVREAEEIEHRVPKLLRRVGGYNLDMLLGPPFNQPHSEGNGGSGTGKASGVGVASTWHTCWWAPRARWRGRDACSSTCRRCPRTRRSASATSPRFIVRWKRRGTSSSSVRLPWSWSIAR